MNKVIHVGVGVCELGLSCASLQPVSRALDYRSVTPRFCCDVPINSDIIITPRWLAGLLPVLLLLSANHSTKQSSICSASNANVS